jgi:hypothetical protein
MSATAKLSERWVAVPGYQGYEVSDLGRVRSVDRVVVHKTGFRARRRGQLLAQQWKGYRREYLTVTLSGGRVFGVADLVLTSFVGPRPDGLLALHRDDDKSHNALTNLYWGTQAENTADRIRNGGYRTPEYLARKGRPKKKGM